MNDKAAVALRLLRQEGDYLLGDAKGVYLLSRPIVFDGQPSLLVTIRAASGYERGRYWVYAADDGHESNWGVLEGEPFSEQPDEILSRLGYAVRESDLQVRSVLEMSPLARVAFIARLEGVTS